jgi:DNA polymerase-3 subunit delta
MQVYPDKLVSQLNKQLHAVYLIFGDEPYQKFTSLDTVRNRAQSQGFAERITFVADSGFEWSTLIEATQSMSLFSAQQIIELELPTGKPGKEGAKTLQTITETPNPDTLLVIHGPKVGKDVQNTKWFKALNNQGVFVPCFPLEGRQLTAWINQLAHEKGCQITPQAIALLSEYCEGNMLAGAQEIEKLALNYPNHTVDVADVEKVVVNQSRYNVFQLVDAFLSGDAKKTTRLLLSLEGEGLEAPIILWALAKEWQTLTELKASNGPINWQSFRIWGARQRLYESAMNRLSAQHLSVLGQRLSYADSVFKSQVIVRPYVALCHLCLMFVHPQLTHFEWEA